MAYLGSRRSLCADLGPATHSAASKSEAARSSRALALQSAYDLKRAKGWSYVNLSARKVKGDPFWKAVRPNGVPPEARLKPDLVSSRFYTTCFTGWWFLTSARQVRPLAATRRRTAGLTSACDYCSDQASASGTKRTVRCPELMSASQSGSVLWRATGNARKIFLHPFRVFVTIAIVRVWAARRSSLDFARGTSRNTLDAAEARA